MPDRLDPERRPRSARTSLLTLATLLSVILVAGCGGSSSAPRTGPATTSASRTAHPASMQRRTPVGIHSSALAFAKCMRSNGVPNFPDPTPGSFLFNPAGINRSAPAFRTAQEKCHALLPRGGPAPAGSTTHPSAQTLAKLLHIAQCMRQHGVPDFPDPQTSVPRNLVGSGRGVITDYDGAILVFPSTLNTHSPAYRQATATCGTLAEKLGNGPHSH